MLVSDQLVLHDLMLRMQLKHLLVILLERHVEHVGEHVLLDQCLLLLCRLLLLQRFQLFADVVLRSLDKVLPNVALLIESVLVLGKEVIK